MNDRLAVLWDEILAFNDEYFPNWRNRDPVFVSNAIAGEVGEICGITKRLAGGGTNNAEHPEDPRLATRDEISDVFIYMTLLLEMQGDGVDAFLVALEDKLRVLHERKEAEIK